MRKGMYAALGAVLLLAPAPLRAQDEGQVKRVQERFMAPCCWNENVAVHRSEIAATMRVEIERMLKEGKTEQQIEARYVAEYGERILVEPRGVTRWWLLIIPVVGIAAGLLALSRYLAKRRGVEPAEPATEGVRVSDEELEW